MTVEDLIKSLESVYCGPAAIEFQHLEVISSIPLFSSKCVYANVYMEDLRHDCIQILVITALFEKQFIFHKFMLVHIKFFYCIYIEVLRRERMVSRRF